MLIAIYILFLSFLVPFLLLVYLSFAAKKILTLVCFSLLFLGLHLGVDALDIFFSEGYKIIHIKRIKFILGAYLMIPFGLRGVVALIKYLW